MASRELVPATKGLPLTTENVAPAKTPVLGGVQNNPVTDHSLRPSHELDHGTVKPVLPLSTQLPARGHTLRGERDRPFFSSDDSALSKQIQATHAPDMEELDVRPILSIIEDIMRLARPLTDDHTAPAPGAQTQAHSDASVDKVSHASYHDDSDIVKVLEYPIKKISCEIVCKCAGGGESHQVTMGLLKSLASYSWDAKVVIAAAAFAINYGEFWLVEHLHTMNPLAKNIATLKDLPEIMAHAGELRKQLEAVLDLLTAILKLSHCIIEFKELPPQYISAQSPEITAATPHIPTAVYWSIRGLLVCASTLLSLVGGGHEYITSTSSSWEILNLAHKLSVILEHLQNQMKICKELVERKRLKVAYIGFKRLLESAHIDNMKVLRAFFRFSEEDQRPLYDGSRKTNERLDVLRLKYVLLLISDLELCPEELHVFHMIQNEHSMRHDYEILWLPIVDPTSSMTLLEDITFNDLRNNVPWYSVEHPSLVDPVAIRYIRKEVHFVHMPMLLVLDPHGKLSRHDALPMMWIWGAKAFPFTQDRERELWDDSDWNIELLADSIDPRIQEWINGNKVICLYGGDDVNWIRKFTESARTAATALNVPLEMLHVGKRNPKEKVWQCHDVITRENLSHIFAVEYYDYVWCFWKRLYSMWNSKKQIGWIGEDDRIKQGILDVLGFDCSGKCWAVFGRGNYRMTIANGDKLLSVLNISTLLESEVDHPHKFVSVLTPFPHLIAKSHIPAATAALETLHVFHKLTNSSNKGEQEKEINSSNKGNKRKEKKKTLK